MAKSKAAAAVAVEPSMPEGAHYVDEVVPTLSLVPDPRNAKIHTKKQIDLIAEWMRKRGVTQPPLIDENSVIIAGHGRRLGALRNVELGFTEFANMPVRRAIGWSEEDKRLYRIADNGINAMTGIDSELMQIEIGDLNAAGLDLTLTGLSEPVLNKMLGEAPTGPPPKEFGADRKLLLVEFEDEVAQQLLYEELQGRGFACKIG